MGALGKDAHYINTTWRLLLHKRNKEDSDDSKDFLFGMG